MTQGPRAGLGVCAVSWQSEPPSGLHSENKFNSVAEGRPTSLCALPCALPGSDPGRSGRFRTRPDPQWRTSPRSRRALRGRGRVLSPSLSSEPRTLQFSRCGSDSGRHPETRRKPAQLRGPQACTPEQEPREASWGGRVSEPLSRDLCSRQVTAAWRPASRCSWSSYDSPWF